MPGTISRQGAAARVRTERPIDLATAARSFTLGERLAPLSVPTLLRWIIHGKRGVKLEAVRIRGRWHTSIAAMTRFVEATSD